MKKYTVIFLVLTIIWMTFCGYSRNSDAFPDANREGTANNPLAGKRIIFLGCSVTYGSASRGVSFADFIAQRNGCEVIKDAVSGTTMAVGGSDSYVSRLRRLDAGGDVDLFVCQLSANDAFQNTPVGTISDSFSMEDFNIKTTAGAIEYIIAYAKEVYGCPVVFFTSPRFDSDAYGESVALLKKIQQKWGIHVIDLWNNETFNDISDEQRFLYLADPIHPTKEGYLNWLTPYFESSFSEILTSRR